MPIHVEGPAGAPALLLAPSLGTSAAMWDPQLPVLTQRFRVISYEHRGHGGRPAPPGPYELAELGADVLSALDEAGAERASIVGLSLGGVLAQWVAANHPERVDRLVLACTAPQLGSPESWFERAATVRSAGSPTTLAAALLGRWFTPGYLELRPEAAVAVAAMLARTSAEGYAGCCEALAGTDLWPDLGRIAAPTLVVAGAEDLVAPPAVALRMQQAIAGSSLLVLPGAAHLANVERAAPFTAAVVDHLAGGVLERGDAVRRQVLGDAQVDRSRAATTPLSAAFLDYLTSAGWGEVWTRPGLDRRTRSCITLAALTALGRAGELEIHLRGARRNGLSDAEIGEVLLHTAVYAGIPAANEAFAIAHRVLEDDGGDGVG